MAIEINNTTRREVDERGLCLVVERFLEKFGQADKSVSLALVGDRVMRRLNREYRGLDKPTDVLAFAESGAEEEGYLGEIVIDLAQIKRQARSGQVSGREELVFILVHGLLHLLGYEDEREADRQEMLRLGKRFIHKHIK